MGTALCIFVIGACVGSIGTSWVWTKTKMFQNAKKDADDKIREFATRLAEKIRRKV